MPKKAKSVDLLERYPLPQDEVDRIVRELVSVAKRKVAATAAVHIGTNADLRKQYSARTEAEKWHFTMDLAEEVLRQARLTARRAKTRPPSDLTKH